jgi:hypothetical protein
MTESLGDKQRRFARLVSEWIAWVYSQGLAVTFGEAFRTPEQARWNQANGKGISNSLHTQRLAIDVNLFRRNGNGQWEWLSDGSAPEWLHVGAHWESMGDGHAWGGRFSKPDANHNSITHNGVK